jgi:oligopeptide transport system permease protein
VGLCHCETMALLGRSFSWSWVGLCLVVLFAIVAPLVCDPFNLNPDAVLVAPSVAHWLGTDDLGRSLLARAGQGAQLSLVIGVAAAGLATLIGTAVGVWAGYKGGWVDQLLIRLMDTLYSLPLLMVVILLSLWLGRGIPSLIGGLAFLFWPDTARLIRGQTQQLMKLEFIEACHSLGGGTWHLISRYLLPNLTRYWLLSITMLIPRAILAESTLSFIGLGIEPPQSTWGSLSSEGWQLVRVAPHMLIVPMVLIIGTMWLLQIISQDLKRQWLETTA